MRLAFVTSVMWSPPSVPPVRFQITQVSMLPNSRSPDSAFSCAPSTLSSDPADLGTGEVRGERESDLLLEARLAPVACENSSTSLSVRVSCHTSALCTGSPVFLSHTSVVSRWLVMPTPAMSSALAPASCIASVDHLLGARPDLVRVVLHPAGLGIDLLVLLLAHAHHLAAVVEDHAARAGRPLVDCCRVLSHQLPLGLVFGETAIQPAIRPGTTSRTPAPPRPPPISGPTTGIQE